MSLSADEIKKIAKLARIRLEDSEVEEFSGKLNSILDWVEQLQEVDTDDVQPMAGVGEATLRLREDVVNDGDINKDVMSNAPSPEFGCFVVPKVIE